MTPHARRTPASAPPRHPGCAAVRARPGGGRPTAGEAAARSTTRHRTARARTARTAEESHP
ncbi:hypothetical protein AB0D45_10965 [Streptomyces sp. NPDC048352]|uniref:hypothetical protein n=1 Tax=Streptomyces sp. NPDC048352 TaxID=3154718 RepID=UPI003434C872